MDGAPRLPGGLPPGRWVTPDPGFAEDGSVAGPVLWVSDCLVPDAGLQWRRLMAAHPDTGLWPLLLRGLYSDPDRPWRSGEQEPVALPGTDAASVDRVLARLWDSASGGTPGDFDWGDSAPFQTGPWPGLAASPALAGDPDGEAGVLALELGGAGDRMIGLVPAGSGSAALAACGWLGAINHASVADIAVVVGSWEERFGARLVAVGFDTVELSVAAPPATPAAALQLAAEHYAFCPDNVGGATQLDEYAGALVGCRHWGFWWDLDCGPAGSRRLLNWAASRLARGGGEAGPWCCGLLRCGVGAWSGGGGWRPARAASRGGVASRGRLGC
jgi:Domain of unknown function (DUF4253)